MDATKRHQNFLGENPNSKLVMLTDTVYPRIKVTYGGVDAVRPAEEIDAEQFIGQKSFKAKGKRLTTWKIDTIEELEPTRFPEPEPAEGEGDEDAELQADGDASSASKDTISENTSSQSTSSQKLSSQNTSSQNTNEPEENLDPDAGKSEQQVIDELTGQTNLFTDDDFKDDEKDKDWLSKQ